MYKIIKIGNEDYRLEYSIEASLYADCITSLTDMLTGVAYTETIKNPIEGIKEFLKNAANIPTMALTMFYAGLMEHHGAHPDGDGKVPNIEAAKRLIAQYMREHKEAGDGSFYDVLGVCLGQMGEDGFFELTGLEKLLTDMDLVKKNPVKKLQDRKRKATVKQS